MPHLGFGQPLWVFGGSPSAFCAIYFWGGASFGFWLLSLGFGVLLSLGFG